MKKKSSSVAKVHKLQWFRMIVWSFVILLVPALILLFYSFLFVTFTGARSAYQSLGTVAVNGYLMLLSSLLVIVGCILRDSRYFSASGILVLPLSMFLSLKSFLALIWFRTRTRLHLVEDVIEFSTEYQRSICNFVLQMNGIEYFFIVLFVTQLFLYTGCMLLPKWLNRSLRVHRILIRKLFLFQFSFKEIDKSFYKY